MPAARILGIDTGRASPVSLAGWGLLSSALVRREAMDHQDSSSQAVRRRKLVPDHRIRICRLESCSADGGLELAEALEERLGIRLDERTADGAISLESLECVGLCGIKQAVTIDDEPFMGRDRVLQAVDDLLHPPGSIA